MKWSVDSFSCSALNIQRCMTMKKMSKEQLTLSVSLAVCAPPPRALSHLPTPFPNAVFYPTPPPPPSPWLFKDPDSLFSHLPLLPSRPERRARLSWMYSRREPTRPVDFFFFFLKRTVRQNPHRSVRSVSRWTDRPTVIALPRDCSERLPFLGWTSSFF